MTLPIRCVCAECRAVFNATLSTAYALCPTCIASIKLMRKHANKRSPVCVTLRKPLIPPVIRLPKVHVTTGKTRRTVEQLLEDMDSKLYLLMHDEGGACLFKPKKE